MGEYVGIKIRNHYFFDYKNAFYDLLTIFCKEDLHISEEIDEEGEPYKRYRFVTNVQRARLILDALGYTVESAARLFDDNRAEEIEYAVECESEQWHIPNSWTSAELEEHFTFEEWVKSVHKFAIILSEDSFDLKSGKYKKLEMAKKKKLSVADKLVLETLPDCDGFFGMREKVDVWTVFRIILDAFDDNEEIILDYTNLFLGGWCDEYPEEKDYYVSKTIVLTEGKFDAQVIQEAMGILYPYMRKYYSFMNFSEYKVQGSTNFLTHYLKAFIGAGIENRVIAIYDNDSAGLSEVIGLKSMTIPDNFRIMKLPDLELANNYPTLGPNGKENMNINGRACSIELFLGEDVLTEANELTPIQWRGYVEKTETYQGEIMNKGLIQEKFMDKVKAAKEGKTYNHDEWNEMDFLLNNIFYAFVNDN